MVTTLIALEVDRAQAPERANEAAVADFLADLLSRKVTDRHNVIARADELGCDLSGGATPSSCAPVLSTPRRVTGASGCSRSAERGARAVDRASLAALSRPAGCGPMASSFLRPRPRRPGEAARWRPPCCSELEVALPGPGDRRAQPPRERPHRPAPRGRRGAAGGERGRGPRLAELAFEQTGAYRLLLPAMSEDPTELEGFYHETVAPLAAYDDQYETELVRTLETFSTPTATWRSMANDYLRIGTRSATA